MHTLIFIPDNLSVKEKNQIQYSLVQRKVLNSLIADKNFR